MSDLGKQMYEPHTMTDIWWWFMQSRKKRRYQFKRFGAHAGTGFTIQHHFDNRYDNAWSIPFAVMHGRKARKLRWLR